MPRRHKPCCSQQTPDYIGSLSLKIDTLALAVNALQVQVGQLKERTEFIWCKVRDIAAANLVDRVGDVESEVDSLQEDTEVLRRCGVLTLDCDRSDSDSSSFSDAGGIYAPFTISGTESPDANGYFTFLAEIFDTLQFSSEDSNEPVQRVDGYWYIGTEDFGWASDEEVDDIEDVENWIPIGDAVGTPVITR